MKNFKTMTRTFWVAAALLVSFLAIKPATAQGPMGRSFGFGLIVGDPLGATIKAWNAGDEAFVFSIGASYFGATRIGADYDWHFNAFRSDVVKMYAGPGIVLGIGRATYGYYTRRGDVFYYREDGGLGIAGRVMAGINIIPRSAPIEMFLEVGPLIGLSPGFGVALDAAAGIRFYP